MLREKCPSPSRASINQQQTTTCRCEHASQSTAGAPVESPKFRLLGIDIGFCMMPSQQASLKGVQESREADCLCSTVPTTYTELSTNCTIVNMSGPVSTSSLFGAIRTCMRPVARKTRPHPRQLSQQPAFSTTAPACQESHVERSQLPRWQQTPPAMAMPVRTRRAPKQPPFLVNEDPALLDNAYRKMLGKEGDHMLPEELKWLAVTHKSFDHARRGFNDRLAYLGMAQPPCQKLHPESCV